MSATRPVDAASLILIDDRERVPKILMGKRHHGLKFMPSKFVFPGGRLDPSDRRASAFGALDHQVEAKLCMRVARASPARARALALAALRETYEETGILIGEPELGDYSAPKDSGWTKFESEKIWPSLDGLEFVARAITPPRYPRRYDTRFFLCRAEKIIKQIEGHAGPDKELTALEWVTFEEAKTLDIPTITALILDALSEQWKAGLPRFRPIPFFYSKNGQHLCDML